MFYVEVQGISEHQEHQRGNKEQDSKGAFVTPDLSEFLPNDRNDDIELHGVAAGDNALASSSEIKWIKTSSNDGTICSRCPMTIPCRGRCQWPVRSPKCCCSSVSMYYGPAFVVSTTHGC